MTTFLLFLATSVYSRSPLLDVLGPMRDEATSKETLLYKHLSHSVRKFSTTSRSRYQTLIEETKLSFTIYFMFCLANLRELITLDFFSDQGQYFFGFVGHLLDALKSVTFTWKWNENAYGLNSFWAYNFQYRLFYAMRGQSNIISSLPVSFLTFILHFSQSESSIVKDILWTFIWFCPPKKIRPVLEKIVNLVWHLIATIVGKNNQYRFAETSVADETWTSKLELQKKFWCTIL